MLKKKMIFCLSIMLLGFSFLATKPASAMGTESERYTISSYIAYLDSQGESDSAEQFSALSPEKQEKVIYYLNHPDELLDSIEVTETVVYDDAPTSNTAVASAYATPRFATLPSSISRTASYTAKYTIAGFTTTQVKATVYYSTSGSKVTSVQSVSGKVVKNVNPLVSISKQSSKTWISSNRAYGQIDWNWKVGFKTAGVKRQTVYGTASGSSGGSSSTL
ncbi:hypothetical protein [Priestia flexa]|uniref:hypothetical protein n=1 Tax=Priestia flexa TaxID=86664 RepID=UPI00289184E7|nr:hypothetical protein [Priestia flexa]MDT2047919.1 hypothetical protein [Priestia flexa]